MPDLQIVLVAEAEIATTQIIEGMLRECARRGLHWTKTSLAALCPADLGTTGVPLFVRCDAPLLRSWVDTLTRAKRPYLYYLDDNFWRIEGDSALAHHYRHPAVRGSIEHAVANASLVLTQSPELAEFVGRFSTRVVVLPTFFDDGLVAYESGGSTAEIRIGFAGSPSRIDDLGVLVPLIDPVLDLDARVVFEFAGVMPSGLAACRRVRHFPHIRDYATYVAFQASRRWDIGLAPLRDSEANRCKTDNKFREFAACGIAGAYADVAPYRRSVESGVTGLLVAGDSLDWQMAISRLVTDPTLRQRLGTQARIVAHQRYALNVNAPAWMERLTANGVPISARRMLAAQPAWRRSLAALRLRQLQVREAFRVGGVAEVARKVATVLTRR